MSNKPVSGTRFPTSGLARRLFLTERQTPTWKWSIEREGLDYRLGNSISRSNENRSVM